MQTSPGAMHVHRGHTAFARHRGFVKPASEMRTPAPRAGRLVTALQVCPASLHSACAARDTRQRQRPWGRQTRCGSSGTHTGRESHIEYVQPAHPKPGRGESRGSGSQFRQRKVRGPRGANLLLAPGTSERLECRLRFGGPRAAAGNSRPEIAGKLAWISLADSMGQLSAAIPAGPPRVWPEECEIREIAIPLAARSRCYQRRNTARSWCLLLAVNRIFVVNLVADSAQNRTSIALTQC